ncbi:PREDICTED: uncharacterized protein LOC101811817, partial [Ficedula albicollis]|uniref:uncharacterized protein LOC101811817 n=1 Tax=Ficedula albicollis TaxID=59894 RepID=UPI0007AD820F
MWEEKLQPRPRRKFRNRSRPIPKIPIPKIPQSRMGWGSLGQPQGLSLGQDPEESCVLLISNLPDKGCSPEEISNLAKPFGGLRDLLILSSHKKLSMRPKPRHRSLGDEEAIFIALIKDSDPKVDAASLRSQLVHLGNLPAEGFRELEVVCAGLRFGKVEHYAVLSNRQRVQNGNQGDFGDFWGYFKFWGDFIRDFWAFLGIFGDFWPRGSRSWRWFVLRQGGALRAQQPPAGTEWKSGRFWGFLGGIFKFWGDFMGIFGREVPGAGGGLCFGKVEHCVLSNRQRVQNGNQGDFGDFWGVFSNFGGILWGFLAERFQELEVVLGAGGGLCFGKVEHYAVLSNRQRRFLGICGDFWGIFGRGVPGAGGGLCFGKVEHCVLSNRQRVPGAGGGLCFGKVEHCVLSNRQR